MAVVPQFLSKRSLSHFGCFFNVTVISLLPLAVCTASTECLRLWYDEPAVEWVEALPIGNGRIGGMVFGDPSLDRIQLNEDTVWAGEPGNNLPEGFGERLPVARELIFEGKFKEAQQVFGEVLPRHSNDTNNYGMAYQTVGNLLISCSDLSSVSEYERELDIENAVASVQFVSGGIRYRREYFVSAVDQVMVIRLTADKPGSISCDLRLDTPQEQYTVGVESDILVLNGVSGDQENKKGKIRFQSRLLPVLDGGELKIEEDHLRIERANSLILYLSIGTNFKNFRDLSRDEVQVASRTLEEVRAKPFEVVKKNHVTDYWTLFDRVSLDLGTTEAANLTTDKRIEAFYDGNDPQLVSLYFQFGRYLLISSSRPGSQPANLQGIWNHRLFPSWDSKYTVNINTEMNYWPADLTNLSELNQPLFEMIRDLQITGSEAASQMYGARGWMVHHNTDLWRMTGPIDGPYYGMWPMGAAWLSQHLWQHFLFSGDLDFLEKHYDALKGVALFFLDTLQEDPETGNLVVNPSMSPENAHPGGTTLASGNTMDNQLVFDVFSNLIRSAETLGVDSAFVEEVESARERLPSMKIGKYGQLQEWQQDWDDVNDRHRHVSHLYGLYPSDQISPFLQPELFAAARNTLEYRGDESTGWSMGWKVNLWARLLDGNRAFKLIREQLTPSDEMDSTDGKGGTYPNLFDAHPPFQIDGNFGCTAGIVEMLVQSHDGCIYLLPALPDAWDSGSVRGIRARGGFTVNLRWYNGTVTEVTLHAARAGTCRLRVGVPLSGKTALRRVEDSTPSSNSFFQKNPVKRVKLPDGIVVSTKSPPKTILYVFEALDGESYTFSNADLND